jgi:predicted transposase/invertase (TIGR01784 family)
MFNEEERQVYEVRKQSLVDAESKIASALEKGMEMGLEKASKAIALNLLGKGIDIVTIAEATGLTVLQITSFSQKGGDE